MTDLFDEAGPAGADAPSSYASAGDVTTVDDLIEIDLVVKRWKAKIRIRALSLDQEDKIELESLKQHPKTKEWYQPPALKTALTLREGIIVPKLDDAQARSLTNKNPHVAGGVARWIRLLSGLDHAAIERYIADTLALDGAPLPVDAAGAGSTAVDQDDSG